MTSRTMTGRVRAIVTSVFFKCSAVMACTTLIVSVVLMTFSAALTDSVAEKAVIDRAESTVHNQAAAIADALRFGAVDKIDMVVAQAMNTAGPAGLLTVVIDGDGEVVTTLGDARAGREALTALAQEAMATGEVTRGGAGFYVAEPVFRNGEGPALGALAMIWTAQPALMAIQPEKTKTMLYGAAVFLVLIVLTTLLLRRMIGRPLNGLSQGINRVAEGDYDTAIPMTGRGDEFGEIADHLGRLVGVLNIARNAEDKRAEDMRDQSEMVTHLADGLNAMANGKLTHKIVSQFPQEYERLRTNYNQAIQSLRDAIVDVTASAHSIRRGAEEISRGSEDLSHRTETQAATLEQTAAALDELVASVKSAAEGASQVDDTVKKANGLVEQNATIMQNAISAMSEIEKSSDQIGEIIGVIDDIAFQTNLLALNAGVEAARAGTAGKGFAVVASEVRALAQRSSDAAQQIKTLIGGSSQQVKSGVQLVEQAGSALTKVVDRVQHISGLVGEIAHGASEQSQGIHEINLGVTNLDRVTQQNAAMVEESTAASHMLSNDATTLSQLVAKFDVGESAPAKTSEPKPRNRAA